MATPYRKSVRHHFNAEGRRCKAAESVRTEEVQLSRYYGMVGGKEVPLSTSLEASRRMLNKLVADADLRRAGLSVPEDEIRPPILSDLLSEYRVKMQAEGSTAAYVELVFGRLKALFDGCGWKTLADLDATAAASWILALGTDRPAPDIPDVKEFTPSEAAALLGISVSSVRDNVQRYNLAATGVRGKSRRYPRDTLLAILERTRRGASPQTRNYYRTHLKTFANWLTERGLLPGNPFGGWKAENVRADRRHDRRELSAEDLRRLLATARASARVFRGLTGPDRFMLYALACATGLRASGLAGLTPESFRLDGDSPSVFLPAQHNKGKRKSRTQPIPPDVAALLTEYLQGKPANQPVWPGRWASDHLGSEMLRGDLAEAGIPYITTGPEGERFADFHSLRHSFLTLGHRSGIDLRTLQELAGHSSPVVTQRYTHVNSDQLADAVQKLPGILPVDVHPQGPESGTETEGGRKAESADSVSVLFLYRGGDRGQTVATGGETDSGEVDGKGTQKTTQTPILSRVGASRQSPATSDADEGDEAQERGNRTSKPVASSLSPRQSSGAVPARYNRTFPSADCQSPLWRTA